MQIPIFQSKPNDGKILEYTSTIACCPPGLQNGRNRSALLPEEKPAERGRVS
jgi:hypothetical protein